MGTTLHSENKLHNYCGELWVSCGTTIYVPNIVVSCGCHNMAPSKLWGSCGELWQVVGELWGVVGGPESTGCPAYNAEPLKTAKRTVPNHMHRSL